MSAQERLDVYQRWIALNRIRLEEPLLYLSKKPLSVEVFNSLIDYLYENIAILLPERDDIDVTFEEWSDDLYDLVLTSYAWSQVMEPCMKAVQEHDLTFVDGNDLVN